MTYEQFCFWLSGYISGLNHDDSNKTKWDILSEELKKVHGSSFSQGIAFQGCHPL